MKWIKRSYANILQLITYVYSQVINNKNSVVLKSNMNDRNIVSAFFPIAELKPTVQEFIEDEYKIFPAYIDEQIERLINQMKPNIQCFFEYPYVDKVYRDSYYKYYSTKHNASNRNCARVSFFSNKVDEKDFRDSDKTELLQSGFFGYITIRPTIPNLIGRTMLSPQVYNEKPFLCCLTKSSVVVNGVKLDICAFPHSSQDGETITCAETTIWSVMEYFGMKYPEYKPILPSIIIQALSNYSFERQLPSRGLTAEQISYALKEFDLGTRLYSRLIENENDGDNEAYPLAEFRRMLGYYVESGIPLIASIENETVGHAIVIIGHKTINHGNIDLSNYTPTDIGTSSGRIKLYDYADFIDDYVVIDDNMPPYNLVPFDDPTYNYHDPQFIDCSIKNFIAPLYQKVYLEAGGARELMLSYLESFDHYLPGEDIILKLFFTSSRSLKSELNERIEINDEANELILNSTMPKFIWLGVFTNPDLIVQSKANGLVILDATESNTEDARILMLSPKGITTYDSKEKLESKYNVYDIEINSFNIFANNLKGEWSRWQD